MIKLKSLPQRLYHISFHLHTVSGIVISFALYIIFFTGAFTLFQEEFFQWENPEVRNAGIPEIDYDRLIGTIKEENPLFDLSDDFRLFLPSHEKPFVVYQGHLKEEDGSEKDFFGQYFPVSGRFSDEKTSTVGETLYRLHFFDQLPYIGRWLSGIVAVLFGFAAVTGLLIHWKNILSRFNGFSVKGGLKQLWTNAHTVFGLIGFPFQLMYAVTGAFYILNILILIPMVMVFFKGDTRAVFRVLRPVETVSVDPEAKTVSHFYSVNEALRQLSEEYEGYRFRFAQLRNYDREDALMNITMDNPALFSGNAVVSLRLKDGRKELEVGPGKKKYVESVLHGIGRVHFANFGGLLTKAVYFGLSLFTCLVIMSGVLLWKEARRKKGYTEKQLRFHHRVTMWYLSICLSLFPAVALLFIAELTVPFQGDRHVFWVNTVFFISWLLLTLSGLFFKTERALARFFLASGTLTALLVPIANGRKTGDWVWLTLFGENHLLALTDCFWILTGILFIVLSVMPWRTFGRERS